MRFGFLLIAGASLVQAITLSEFVASTKALIESTANTISHALTQPIPSEEQRLASILKTEIAGFKAAENDLQKIKPLALKTPEDSELQNLYKTLEMRLRIHAERVHISSDMYQEAREAAAAAAKPISIQK